MAGVIKSVGYGDNRGTRSRIEPNQELRWIHSYLQAFLVLDMEKKKHHETGVRSFGKADLEQSIICTQV